MKSIIVSLLAGLLGVVLLLSGLAWDAILHSADPTLAEREGIFTLSNPGHALLAAGMALTCGGIIAALYFAWGMTHDPGLLGHARTRKLATAAASFGAMGAVVFAMAMSASGHEHGHAETAADGHVHAHDDLVSMPLDVGTLMPSAAELTPHEHPAPTPEAQVVAQPSGAEDMLHAHEEAPAPATQAEPVVQEEQPHAHEEAPPPEPMAPAPAEMPTDAGHDHGAPAAPATADEAACGAALVEDVRAATARFETFDVAVAEGYVKNTPGQFVAHYHNWSYGRDGKVLDLGRPEDLMYVKTTTGMHLAGVMFLGIKGKAPPQPCGSVTSWHTHDNICFNTSTGAVVGITNAQGDCPAGSILYVPPDMMHVWLVPNPNGQFDAHMDPQYLLGLFN